MDKTAFNAQFDLTGRVAIVTGGSRGIGSEIAETAAALGAQVVVASRKADACAAVVERITSEGGTAIAVPTHCGRVDELEALAVATVDRFGAIDIVVNNAANALAAPIGAITQDAWDKAHAVNVRGPLFLVQAALPHLRASEHASIVNVISAGVFTPATYMGIYISAKNALLSLTRTMAAELVGDGIRANALAPGVTDTDMVRHNPPDVQKMMVNSCAMRRMAARSEIANAAIFLMSDASSYMTGQALVVDGGMTFR
jgi:NAD(P)-dependent dehydrogenase (short-subunit alcohol dehydrogenase family)